MREIRNKRSEIKGPKLDGGKVRTFRDLIVWQRSRELAREIYTLTSEFPREELYGMTSQLRRASVSVMSNIAEGHGRGSIPQLMHFLLIARGSNFEVQSQLILASDLGLAGSESILKCEMLCDEIGRMLYATLSTLRQKSSRTKSDTQDRSLISDF